MADTTVTEQPETHDYSSAVVDLLGALAYGEITAFTRLAEDAELAPSLLDKVRLGRLAVREFSHFESLATRLTEMDADVEQAMAPFAPAVDAFHDRTAPSTWLEGLVKAYVGDGIATDFYREVSRFVDDSTRELVEQVVEDAGRADFVVSTVRNAIEADPRIGGRLALWARRLVGEALSQAQRVVADREALAGLLVGGLAGGPALPGADLAEVGRMFTRLIENHTRRMAQLGLTA